MGETPASLDVGAGETVTCTFTNTKQAKIIVTKVTVPACDPQDFNFSAPLLVPNTFVLDTDPLSTPNRNPLSELQWPECVRG